MWNSVKWTYLSIYQDQALWTQLSYHVEPTTVADSSGNTTLFFAIRSCSTPATWPENQSTWTSIEEKQYSLVRIQTTSTRKKDSLYKGHGNHSYIPRKHKAFSNEVVLPSYSSNTPPVLTWIKLIFLHLHLPNHYFPEIFQHYKLLPHFSSPIMDLTRTIFY